MKLVAEVAGTLLPSSLTDPQVGEKEDSQQNTADNDSNANLRKPLLTPI